MKKFYMPIVNQLKVGTIWLCDLVNMCYDPFDLPLDRNPTGHPSSLEPLFYADVEARFMQPTGEFWYQIPRPVDAGDTALFQGLATAMKILKNADVTNQVNFINTLFINGTLIRGYDNNEKPNDTASNDSATGMLFFFYTALRWGTPAMRNKAGALLRVWCNSLRAHNWALVDLNGNPTQYGALEQGWKTDPLRMTLLLAILSVAMAYDPSFNQDYANLYHTYRPILAYPKVKLLWWDTDYDTHRAAIHLHVLYWMTKDEVYARGLRRIWHISEHTQNAWVYTLCSIAMANPDGSLVWRNLSTFDFTRRRFGNIESINSLLDENGDGYVPSVNWGGTMRARYALPFYRRGSQEFFWQRNMFSLDEWIGNKMANCYHSGLDFLICAWLAYRLGLFQ